MGDRYRSSRPRSPTLYNPARASLPIDSYRDYPSSPVRSDHSLHSTPRREVFPGPRSSNPVVTSVPVTTTTYKVSADPISRTSSVREGSRTRRSTLDGGASKPVVSSSHSYRPRDRPVIHTSSARPQSPLHDAYRSSQEEYYAVPASSSRRHHQPRYSATMDNADMNRLSNERDSAHHLRAGAPPARAYPGSRPVYSGPVVPHTADYADGGYGYTTPRDLVQWDLNNAAAVPRHSRNSSYDRGRPSSITGYSDIAPVRPMDNRPPASMRGFDRIPQSSRVAPTYGRERDRMDSRIGGLAPVEAVRPVAAIEGPRREHTSQRPTAYYHEREKRGSRRDDYEVREEEPRYRSERHRHDRRDNGTEERSRTDREKSSRSERHEHRHDDDYRERKRHDDDYKDHKRRDDDYKDHKRRDDDYEDYKKHDDDKKERKDGKDHKGRDAAVAGLSLAGAALGVKAFKESADDHDDRRDYDDDNRRRRDPRDDKDAAERRPRDDSPARDGKERPIEIVEPPRDRHGSRSGRDADPEYRRDPANGSAIETESSASDETRPRRLKRRESGPAFNPRNTSDLRALKEALNKEPDAQAPPKARAESTSKDSQALAEIRSDLDAESGALRIVAPAGSASDTKPQVKGILRQPRDKFPEDPAPIREGVAPLKDAKKDGVPPSARWTKISRKLVNPEALELGKERYEAREDFVIVLRVLSRDEVQQYAEATELIRSAREKAEEEEARAHRHERRSHHRRSRRESDADAYRSSARSQRHSTRDRDRPSESDSASDSYNDKGDRVRDRRASRDRDRPKAIEGGPVMSGGLGDDERKRDEKKASSKTDDATGS